MAVEGLSEPDLPMNPGSFPRVPFSRGSLRVEGLKG